MAKKRTDNIREEQSVNLKKILKKSKIDLDRDIRRAKKLAELCKRGGQTTIQERERKELDDFFENCEQVDEWVHKNEDFKTELRKESKDVITEYKKPQLASGSFDLIMTIVIFLKAIKEKCR